MESEKNSHENINPETSEAEEILGSMPDFEEYRQSLEEDNTGSELESSGYMVEAWTDFPDISEGIDETEPDINGVPQTVWRGERLYLDNIDELGRRDISTKGHEAKNNRDGQTFLSRDKKYASLYAVGTDGVTWYDEPLLKEQIPIGVLYKINNSDNHLEAAPTDDEPDEWGAFAGKFREFTTEKPITREDYTVEEIYIMDDFLQSKGHARSDFRRPMEVYKVSDQTKIDQVIDKIKQRMSELDEQRKTENK